MFGSETKPAGLGVALSAMAILLLGCDESAMGPPEDADLGVHAYPGRTLTGEAAKAAFERMLHRVGGPEHPGISVVDYRSLKGDVPKEDDSGHRADVQADEEQPPEFRYLYTWLLPEDGPLLEQGAYTEMETGEFTAQVEHWKYAEMDDRNLPEEYASEGPGNQGIQYFPSDRWIDCSSVSEPPVWVTAWANHRATGFGGATTVGQSPDRTEVCEGEGGWS